VRENWIRVSVLLAFIRANLGHVFQYSVLPLIGTISDLICDSSASEKFAVINCDKFIGSRFVRACLLPQTVVVSTTPLTNLIGAVSGADTGSNKRKYTS
jgi:hypothetical protein